MCNVLASLLAWSRAIEPQHLSTFITAVRQVPIRQERLSYHDTAQRVLCSNNNRS